MSIHDGHRVYNGCPDDTLRRRLEAEGKAEQELLDQLRSLGCAPHVTYFPMEQKYMVFSDLRPLGEMRGTRIAALHSAIASVS